MTLGDCTTSPIRGQGTVVFSLNGKKRIAAADLNSADISSCNKLHHFLLNRGVYFGPSGYEVGFISSAHTTEQLAFSAEQIKEGLEAIYQ